MAKTLKDFLNERQLGPMVVKNPDEQKFIDKHVVAKTADRNGNGDDVFKAEKVKKADRKSERHGYEPGEDEEVYEALEGNQHKIDANKNGKVDAHDFQLLRKKKKVAEEAEELDELSPSTMGSYTKKASADFTARKPKMGYDGQLKKMQNRKVGVNRALDKIYGEKAEGLDEKLNMDKASMGTVVKDFQKSDAPQFMGKSQKKRQVMAIAAKLSADRGGKPLNKEERLLNKLGDIAESHKRTMIAVFEKLNEDNQHAFMQVCDTPEGVEQMLDFSIQHRGE
jgi:hypothetical protein